MRSERGEVTGALTISADITERKRLESQLVHAQKLESIGQLAAGIAHEINTPAQYVGDNTRFVRDEFDGLLRLLDLYASQLDTSSESLARELRAEEISKTIESIDYEFLRDEVPRALEQSIEGIERITHIVKAMKTFSHPGSQTMEHADLNKAIESTVTVCENRWKYAAELELDLDPAMPDVPCLLGDFNQVILNLVVNAADALEARHGEQQNKGRIEVRTRVDGAFAVVEVTDTAGGVPAAIRDRIFDPFFTTKGVGKGTGQGLSICQDVIVKKHGGTLECDVREGEGTTFRIRLPLRVEQEAQRAA